MTRVKGGGFAWRTMLVGFLIASVALFWAGQALAAQTLCKAEVSMRDGSTVNIQNIAAMAYTSGPFTSRTLLAQQGDEAKEIYIDQLKSLEVTGRSGTREGVFYVEFNCEFQNGSAMILDLRGETHLVGRSDMGYASIGLEKVKSVKLDCPPRTDYRAPRLEMH